MTLTHEQVEAMTDTTLRYARKAIQEKRYADAERMLLDIANRRLEARHEKAAAGTATGMPYQEGGIANLETGRKRYHNY